MYQTSTWVTITSSAMAFGSGQKSFAVRSYHNRYLHKKLFRLSFTHHLSLDGEPALFDSYAPRCIVNFFYSGSGKEKTLLRHPVYITTVRSFAVILPPPPPTFPGSLSFFSFPPRLYHPHGRKASANNKRKDDKKNMGRTRQGERLVFILGPPLCPLHLPWRHIVKKSSHESP